MKRFFPRPWLAGLLCALALPAWAAFTDNGDGTITDSTTGLVWDKCSRGQVWDNTTPPGTCTGAASSYDWAAALAEAMLALARDPARRAALRAKLQAAAHPATALTTAAAATPVAAHQGASA